MAYLIERSKFLPRIIGILLAVEGIPAYLVKRFSLFLEPALQPEIFPYCAATAIAAIALCLWLLITGVDRAMAGPLYWPKRHSSEPP